jgi:GNAT superfamily N-acetyltransferase
VELLVRPYSESDFEQVAEVWFQSWESTGVNPPNPELRAELRERLPRCIAEEWLIHVAAADTKIVGFAALKGDELDQLFVAPDLQRRGVGKLLLDFVKAQRPNGFWLTTPAVGRACHFYEIDPR